MVRETSHHLFVAHPELGVLQRVVVGRLLCPFAPLYAGDVFCFCIIPAHPLAL